jgi:ribosomal protein S18 acetylase RimI-like enzyme
VNYRIAQFGGAAEAPSADLSALHGALLPHSPVALLGESFMRRFYYAVLPAEDFVFGAVAYVDERPAGFVVATADSDGFMGSAIRRHAVRLGWVLGTGMLTDWRRIGAAWEAFQIMRGRRSQPQPEPIGELLSFGVLKEYRDPAFSRRTKLRISQDLFASALDELRARRVRKVRVLVDKDNSDAKLFYRAHDWELSATDIPGWRKPQVEFRRALTGA